MDRFRIIIPDEVFDQLDAIYEYVKNDSPQNAQKLLQRLIDAMYSLELFPMRCPRASTRRYPAGKYRKLLSKPYLIYFRVDVSLKFVFVVDIRHGARRPD